MEHTGSRPTIAATYRCSPPRGSIMNKLAALVCTFLVLAVGARAQDVNDLVKQLKAKDEEQRRLAAKSLGEMGADAKTAAPALVLALKDDDLFVRRFAAHSLGEISPDAKIAVPALKSALNDGKKEVAGAAADSLGKLGGEGVKVLGDVIKNDKLDVELRRKAIVGLGKAGADVKSVLPQLGDLLQSKDLRVDVISALGELGPNAKDDKILKSLQDILGEKGVKKDFKQLVQTTIRRIEGKSTDK
jgi:HEAT repeat protein